MKWRDVVAGAVGSMAMALAAIVANSAAPPATAVVSEAQEIQLTTPLIREIQFMLLRLGMDPGPIDGVIGPQTISAGRRFVERFGLSIIDLVSNGKISVAVLTRLRSEASRVILESERIPAPFSGSPSAATPPGAAVAPVQPAPQPDRFAPCSFDLEDFRIGGTQYTPDKFLQVAFDGSTARAVANLRTRLDEARQIAGNIGGSALTEVQRQARVLDYFSCRLRIEQASDNKN